MLSSVIMVDLDLTVKEICLIWQMIDLFLVAVQCESDCIAVFVYALSFCILNT